MNFILDTILLKFVANSHGTFTARYPSAHGWLFSDDVYLDVNGAICWRTIIPEGVVIKHPCGTKQWKNVEYNREFWHTKTLGQKIMLTPSSFLSKSIPKYQWERPISTHDYNPITRKYPTMEEFDPNPETFGIFYP